MINVSRQCQCIEIIISHKPYILIEVMLHIHCIWNNK